MVIIEVGNVHMEHVPQSTSTGEPILNELPMCVPKILIPRPNIDLKYWACCPADQYTLEPDYWEDMTKIVHDAPSTLRLIYPQIYLNSDSEDPEAMRRRIDDVREAMSSYYHKLQVFHDPSPGFIAIDRKTQTVSTRKGLMVALDLNAFDYGPGSRTLIRPTAETIESLLPARMMIRKAASLEIPHIIVIIDDPDKTVIEPLFAKKGLTEEEYSVHLMKGAGSVKAYRTTHYGSRHVQDSLRLHLAKEEKRAAAEERLPLLMLVGDGNLELATAKRCWEELREAGCSLNHPRRFALVELQNLHDDGVVFDPMHRVVHGCEPSALLAFLERVWKCKAKGYQAPMPVKHIALVYGPGPYDRMLLTPPADKLPVVSLAHALKDFEMECKNIRINCTHDEDALIALCDGSATGLLLPKCDKSRFVSTIYQHGVLPAEAFSMGDADEKRFYIEARCLEPQKNPYGNGSWFSCCQCFTQM